MRLILYRDSEDTVVHYCPGCKRIHSVYVGPKQGERPAWRLTGTPDSPTLHPSVRFFYPKEAYEQNPDLQKYECHYNIEAGRIKYYADCTHEFATQDLELPHLTEDQLHNYY